MLDIGTRRELFVDRLLIEELHGTSLRLHHPVPANRALTFDQPWEGAFCGYCTVIAYEGRYLLYYRGWPDVGPPDKSVACLAVSDDGITFTRPELGLFEVAGTRANNVVVNTGPGTHNFAPFLDTRPGVPENERFKALGSHKLGDQRGLAGFVSADGLHWRSWRDQLLITKGAFDSQNVAFWSEHEGCYVCYFRSWFNPEKDPAKFKGVRTVSRATSDDFVTWSEPEMMDYGDTPPEQLYTNQTHPYCRAPHIYLSLPKRFTPNRKTLTDAEVEQYGIISPYANEVSDGVFMTSRGGTHYDRLFMEAFLRPGPERANWVSRTNMAVNNVVETAPGELSLYYQHRYAQPAQYLQRYTLRADGFISVNAPYAGGELLTKPFRFGGNRLELNYATSGPGGILVEIQDEKCKPIPGFSLAEATEVFGDQLDRVVSWSERRDLSALAGKPIRLRFVMKDADLYALRFPKVE